MFLQAHPKIPAGDYTTRSRAHKLETSCVPVKCLLDDFPSARHFEEREQVRHADTRASEVPGPSGDLEANDRNGIENVDADYAGFDLGGRTILVDPVEEELGPGGESFPA